MFKITSRTLDRWIISGKIGHLRDGKIIRFNRSHVLERMNQMEK